MPLIIQTVKHFLRLSLHVFPFVFCADHPYYVGVQYHPEYLSRPMMPSAPYLGLILASCGKLSRFISRGARLSPRASYDYNPDDDLDDEVTQAFSRHGNLSFNDSPTENVFLEKTD